MCTTIGIKVGRFEFGIRDESLNVVRDTEQIGASAAWRIQTPTGEVLITEIIRLRSNQPK